jgi:hypothetical protein
MAKDFGGFDDDFPIDQFADLSTFSSTVETFSSSSVPVVEKKVSKVVIETPKVIPVVAVSKESPASLISQLASLLVARLYEVAHTARDDLDQRLVKNCLDARSGVSAFAAMVSKHIEFTVLQALYQFADEKKAELGMIWAQYNQYKRTKPKDNMSKRQFLVLITHWLNALATLESSAVTRSYEAPEEKDSGGGEGRGSKTLFGLNLGKSRDSKSTPAQVAVRSNAEVLQELHQMCLFSASSLLPHVDVVMDAAWERLYLHDVAFGLAPRGDPSAPEGCQSKFVLNFFFIIARPQISLWGSN